MDPTMDIRELQGSEHFANNLHCRKTRPCGQLFTNERKRINKVKKHESRYKYEF